MQNEVKDELYPEKVFLSSPPVAAKGPLGGLLHIAPVKFLQNLKQLPLTVPVSGLMDLSKLSHDPRVYESYVTDEFNVLKTHTKTIFELLAEARDVFSRPLRVKCDLYSAVGTADGLVEAKTVISYFNDVEKNAKFKVIEDGYHELHNEIEKYREPYLSFLKESLMDSIYV
jgi:alpha-beta hydrolase superfamily lysophospholipase